MTFSFNMEMMVTKGSALMFLLFTSLLLTTSFAGVERRLSSNLATQLQSKGEMKTWMREDEETIKMHRRTLRVHVNDYENYDSTPSFSKPSSKMIPN
ncbi:hypothetical protein LUZ63_015626 [Rhynchospora breviuscula]|uniref:Uncharacterized protein n=1 Tax=Rhynchospora breviuscula TaxID=2022672 RepID=A0A9Q0CCN9_9POAL|nr:hypothetical protein LUZ63_015626 [Rhynchospora breviuscula]